MFIIISLMVCSKTAVVYQLNLLICYTIETVFKISDSQLFNKCNKLIPTFKYSKSS